MKYREKAIEFQIYLNGNAEGKIFINKNDVPNNLEAIDIAKERCHLKNAELIELL